MQPLDDPSHILRYPIPHFVKLLLSTGWEQGSQIPLPVGSELVIALR